MSRIIINFPDGMAEAEALGYTLGVINLGRVSNGGKQFCYASLTNTCAIQTSLSKTGTDSFLIYYREGQ